MIAGYNFIAITANVFQRLGFRKLSLQKGFLMRRQRNMLRRCFAHPVRHRLGFMDLDQVCE